jgi:hypothetical protein
MNAVRALCRTATLLINGEIAEFGSIEKVLSLYGSSARTSNRFERVGYPSSPVWLKEASAHYHTDTADHKPEIRLELTFYANENVRGSIDIRLKDRFGAAIGFATVGGFNPGQMVTISRDKSRFLVHIDASGLAKGVYTLSVDLAIPNVSYLDRVEDCLSIDIGPKPAGQNQRVLEQDWGFGSFLIDAALA